MASMPWRPCIPSIRRIQSGIACEVTSVVSSSAYREVRFTTTRVSTPIDWLLTNLVLLFCRSPHPSLCSPHETAASSACRGLHRIFCDSLARARCVAVLELATPPRLDNPLTGQIALANSLMEFWRKWHPLIDLPIADIITAFETTTQSMAEIATMKRNALSDLLHQPQHCKIESQHVMPFTETFMRGCVRAVPQYLGAATGSRHLVRPARL